MKRSKPLIPDSVILRADGILAGPVDGTVDLREEYAFLAESYCSLLHKLDKTVSISDRYQAQLRDLNSRLEVTASTDLLTGLWNRRKIMAQLEAEQSRAERHGTTFSLLIVDLDHFKLVNDRFGHLAGDRLLKAVADTLLGNLRVEDCCGRWGGEEFMIVLPETGLQDACQVAEKLIAGVRLLEVPWEGRQISVTMSVGVGGFTRGRSLDDCIKLVDDALFVAKKDGRDRYFAVEG